MSTEWDVEGVLSRLNEAASTLRASPASDTRFRRGVVASWPDYDNRWTSYGYTKASAPPPKPSQGAIARTNEVVAWIGTAFAPGKMPRGMPIDTGRILWWRAEGKSWSRIIDTRKRFHRAAKPPGGNSRASLNRVYNEGVAYLVSWLVKTGKPVRLPDFRD